ncbi:alpha/beta hydrolase [Bartonella sp. LJL80]
MANVNTAMKRREFLGASAAALTGALAANAVSAAVAVAQTAPVPIKTEPMVIGYKSDKITIERVRYTARNTQTEIVANLFKPAGFSNTKKYAAIVVVHPNGGVKEQTAGLYAAHLAELGFITLAYDSTYQGESSGLPRLMENPPQRVDNISDAIDYVSTLSFVDPERVGVLGICAGGGYAMSATQTDLRIKAVATISMFDMGEARREAMGALSYDARMARLKEAADERSKEANGGVPRLINIVPDSPEAFTDTTPVSYRQGYEYYRTPERALHPNSPNRYVFSSLPQQMAFFPFSQIETISPRPILVIAGSEADSKFWSDKAFEKAKEPKERFVVEGATHIDMYDRMQFVTPAVERLNRYFSHYLQMS